MNVGKALLLAGLLIAAVGLVLMLASKLGLRPFRLPGDVVWRGKNTTVYFPVATSILLSIVLTFLLGWIARR